jgi:glycosyltransferase involved in cell wall biosynthesis
MDDERIRVVMVETGGWGGIHHYAYGLCDALRRQPVVLELLTHEQYELAERPHNFQRVHFFRRENYLRTLGRLWRRWRDRRPQVLHVQSLLAPRKDWLLFLLCRALGIRIVLTAHNILPHELRFFEGCFYRHYYRLAQAVIVHSMENKQRLLEQAPELDQGKVFVVPHGNYAHFRDLELGRDEARRQLGLPAGRQMVLFLGAIRPYKGVDLLLQAVGAVRQSCPQALFVVAGHVLRGRREDYEQLAVSLGLGPDDLLLRFAYLSTAEAIAYVCASDLVVLPYRKIYQSGILFLAGSFGRPVLATRVGSFPETIEEGRSGWLVEPGDLAGLQQVLVGVLQEPQRLVEVGAYARHLAHTRHSWDDIARQTVRVYERAHAGAA